MATDTQKAEGCWECTAPCVSCIFDCCVAPCVTCITDTTCGNCIVSIADTCNECLACVDQGRSGCQAGRND